MALQQIDINTPQPNGKFGESTRSANIKHNSNITEVGQRLEALEADSGGAGEAIDDLREQLQQEVLERQEGMVVLHQADTEAGARIDAEQVARQQLAESVWERLRSMGRNRLINGDHRFWQRRTSGRVGVGAGSLGSEAYFADRFSASALNCTVDVSRGVVGSGATTLPPGISNAILYNVSNLGSNPAAWTGQRIEDVRSLQGEVTLSMYLNGLSGTKVGVRAIQQFGDGGSASVSTEAGVFTCSTDPSLVQISFVLPSTAGKAVGANSSVYLVIDLCGAGYGGQIANQAGVFAISAIQLEQGGEATDFEQRPESDELLRCQRYCQKSFPVREVPGNNSNTSLHRVGAAYNGQRLRTSVKFSVCMRSAPAVTFYSGSEGGNLTPATSWRYFDPAGSAWRAASTTELVAAFETGFIVDLTASSFNASGCYLTAGQYLADSELP